MLLHHLSMIQLTSIGFLNTIIQALILGLGLFLLVPIVGMAIDSVFVFFLRILLARVFTGYGEMILTNYVMIIGVVIHEMSHALFALITGARITEVALFKPEDGSLGHVSIVPRGNKYFRALQESFSACAPVVMGILILTLMIFKLFPVLNATWQWIIAIYVFVSVLFHMNMSKADLRCYFEGAGPLLTMALPICLVVVIFGA